VNDLQIGTHKVSLKIIKAKLSILNITLWMECVSALTWVFQ